MILEKKLKEVLMKAIETLGWRLAEPTFTLPKQKEHGDLATNIAFILAKQVGKPPIAVAQELVARIQPSPSFLKKIDVANPGFINFHIHPNAYFQLLSTIFKQGKKFGSQQLGKGTKIILETKLIFLRNLCWLVTYKYKERKLKFLKKAIKENI